MAEAKEKARETWIRQESNEDKTGEYYCNQSLLI